MFTKSSLVRVETVCQGVFFLIFFHAHRSCDTQIVTVTSGNTLDLLKILISIEVFSIFHFAFRPYKKYFQL